MMKDIVILIIYIHLLKKDKCNVVAVGPGLGISRYTKKMVVDLIIFLSQQKMMV